MDTTLDAHLIYAHVGAAPAFLSTIGSPLKAPLGIAVLDLKAEARLAPADAVLVVLRAATKSRLDLRTMVCGLTTR